MVDRNTRKSGSIRSSVDSDWLRCSGISILVGGDGALSKSVDNVHGVANNYEARDPQAMLTLSTYTICLWTTLMIDIKKLVDEEIGPLRIDVTATAKWPLWVLRNATPFTPGHFRQSSGQIFLVLVFVFLETVFLEFVSNAL